MGGTCGLNESKTTTLDSFWIDILLGNLNTYQWYHIVTVNKHTIVLGIFVCVVVCLFFVVVFNVMWDK